MTMNNNHTHSIKFNYFMNFLVKVSGVLFSFISYPYAFRILGTEQMGTISFAISFSALFAMVAVLGIPVYGIRECAKVRDNPIALSKTVSELLLIQFCATATSLLLFATAVQVAPRFEGHKLLYLIQAMVILSSSIQVDWVFTAMEQFGYIALRTTAVKAVMTGSVFLLVREANDYLIYALLLAGATIVTNLVNLFRLFRFVGPLKLNIYGASCHLKPVLIFFIQTVAITIYTSMGTVMLGFLKGEYAVGIYDAGIKIKLILSYFVTGMSTVLLPKVSFCVAKGQKEDFQTAISKTMEFIFLLSFPMIIFFGVMADETMALVCGMRYGQGELLLQTLLPTIFLIGCSSMLDYQILTPTHRERFAMMAYLVGAGVNLMLNFLLIPYWSMVGAAVATLLAEVSVLGVELGYLRKEISILCKKSYWKTPLIASVMPTPFLYLVKNRLEWLPAQFVLSGCVYGVLWLGILICLKEPLLMSLKKRKN